MGEWIRFTPSKEHIGLHARFRKIVKGDIEETIGTVVNNPDPYPWHLDVAIKRDGDGAQLPFPNGSCPFWQKVNGEKKYIGEPFEVEYYYQEIDNDKIQFLCRSTGKSYAVSKDVLCEVLMKDAETIIEANQRAMPRLLSDQLKRENERLRKAFGK